MLILLLDAVSVLIHTLGFLLLLALVSLSVEPDEEDEVKTAVEHQDEVEADREATGRVDEGHDPVDKHHNELDQLHRSEVPEHMYSEHKPVTNFRLQTTEERTSSTRDASGPWGHRRTGSSRSTSHSAPRSSTCHQKSCYLPLVSRS